MAERSEVVIVGGGVAGCAAAYYLARRGREVTIVEREGLACGASGYSAGGINPIDGVPEPVKVLAMESYRLHVGLWDELRELSGRDFSAKIGAKIMLAEDDSHVPPLQQLVAEYEGHVGLSARWVDAAELRAIEPRLGPQIIGGLELQGNGVLNSGEYTIALAEASQRFGARVRTGTVEGLERSGGRVSGVRLADGVIACEQVVLAMGPWSQEAETWLDISLPIEPLKGEILRLRPPGRPPSRDFVSRDASLYTRADGLVWCGTTHEWAGFDREPTEAARRQIFDGVCRIMPAMAEATLVKHTACLRPLAPDNLPIIGLAPGWENAYLATGAGKKGILFSTTMGKAIADLIVDGATPLSIGPCAPERLAGMSGVRGMPLADLPV